MQKLALYGRTGVCRVVTIPYSFYALAFIRRWLVLCLQQEKSLPCLLRKSAANELVTHSISQHLLASTYGQSLRINFKIPEKTDNVLKQHYSKLFMNLLVSFLNRKLHRILLSSHSHKK